MEGFNTPVHRSMATGVAFGYVLIKDEVATPSIAFSQHKCFSDFIFYSLTRTGATKTMGASVVAIKRAMQHLRLNMSVGLVVSLTLKDKLGLSTCTVSYKNHLPSLFIAIV